MAKRSVHVESAIGPGVVNKNSYVLVRPAYRFVDGTLINWPDQIRFLIENGEVTIPGVEDTYLGEDLVWEFTFLNLDALNQPIAQPRVETVTFEGTTGSTVEYTSMHPVDPAIPPAYGPSYLSQALEARDEAREAAAAAEQVLADLVGDRPGYTIVLVAGQSNANGAGHGGDNVFLDPTDPRVKQFGGLPSSAFYRQPVTAVEPLLHHFQYPAGDVGFALAFGREFVKTLAPSRTLLLVPVAHADTGFTVNGLSQTWDRDNTTATTNLYNLAVAQATLAMQSGPFPENNEFAGVLWHQGERDAGLTAAQYATYWDRLASGFRSEISGAANAWILLGQMLPEGIVPRGETAVHAAHIATPGRVEGTAFAYGPTGLYNPEDTPPVHYSAAGQRKLAVSYLRALPRALANHVGGAPLPVTSAPTLRQSSTNVIATWEQPTSRVTDYLVEYRQNGGSWLTFAHAATSGAEATIPGFTLGATVEVRVSTISEAGTAAVSPIGSIVLTTLPAQATGLTLGTPTGSTQPLTWAAAARATSYRVDFKLSSSGTWTLFATTTGTAFTVTGLTPETAYDFRVLSLNDAGAGPVSATVSGSTAPPDALIDAVGVAAHRAYSLKRVKATAVKAIRVRRSSDNAEQDIGFATGGGLDVTALLAFVGAGSAFVVTWYDQSGNGRDVTQATQAAQPRIVNAGVVDSVGGQPAVFLGGAAYLESTTVGLIAAGASSMLGVLSVSTATNGRIAAAESSTTTAATQSWFGLASGLQQNAAVINDAGTGLYTGTASSAMPTAAVQQVSLVDSGTFIQGFRNGAAATPGTTYTRAGSTFTISRFDIGTRYSGAGTPAAFAYWNGYISELVFFAVALTSGQRAIGEGVQKGLYGTP